MWVSNDFGANGNLKFEIANGKNRVKFGGKTFLPARKALEISGRILEQISGNFVSKFATFFQILTEICDFLPRFTGQAGNKTRKIKNGRKSDRSSGDGDPETAALCHLSWWNKSLTSFTPDFCGLPTTFDTEYDRAKGPRYKGSAPRPPLVQNVLCFQPYENKHK